MKAVLNEKELQEFKKFAESKNIAYNIASTSTDTQMVWSDGPALTAMRRGAVLCLDEIDQGRTSIMSLQTIAQGKNYHVKKTNEVIEPKDGFMVIGTANTKGDGEGMDRFSGAQIMNEAFLERFAIFEEQDYPTKATEEKILKFHTKNTKFIKKLIVIGQSTRELKANGELEVCLTTRRLVQIAKNYEIFQDENIAYRKAVARFDKETQLAMIEAFEKLQVQEDDTTQKSTQTPQKNRRLKTTII